MPWGFGVGRDGFSLSWVEQTLIWGFPGGTRGKEPTCQCRRCKRRGFGSLVGKIPPENGKATHTSIFVWRIPWAEEPGRLQSIMSQELDTTEHEARSSDIECSSVSGKGRVSVYFNNNCMCPETETSHTKSSGNRKVGKSPEYPVSTCCWERKHTSARKWGMRYYIRTSRMSGHSCANMCKAKRNDTVTTHLLYICQYFTHS